MRIRTNNNVRGVEIVSCFILDFTNIKDSIVFIISNKLSSDDLSSDDINSSIKEAFSDKEIILALERDINAIFFKDPACNYFFQLIILV